MKTFLLAVSLIGNAVLTVLVVTRSNAPPSAPLRPQPAVQSPAEVLSLSRREDGAAATVALLPPPATTADDFAGLHARLQAAGLPEEIARFATTAAVKRHYNERRLVLGLRPDPANFTRNPITSASSESPETRALKQVIEDEEREQLDALFGSQPEYSLDTQRRLYAGLSDDKAAKLRTILGDYRAIQARLNGQNPDQLGTPEMRAKAAVLQKEMRSYIEALLTPEELFTYDLRNSSPAGSLRNRLGAFQATEEEFRALYPLFKTAEDAGLRRVGTELDGEMRRILGESRFAEVQAANALAARQSQAFVEARSFVVARNLSPTVTNDLLMIHAEFQPRLAALEQARAATPLDREAQLAALRAEAEARLTRLFGQEGFEAYVKAQGGWLRSR